MSLATKFLFPYSPIKDNQYSKSLLILALRLLLGFLFLSHGLDKWHNFALLEDIFPDPLGISSRSSLILAIFGELICSVGFLVGFLFRLAIIPMITTMATAFFMVQGGEAFSVKELSFLYLALFIILFFAGPGSFSIDSYIGRLISKKHSKKSTRIRNPMM